MLLGFRQYSLFTAQFSLTLLDLQHLLQACNSICHHNDGHVGAAVVFRGLGELFLLFVLLFSSRVSRHSC